MNRLQSVIGGMIFIFGLAGQVQAQPASNYDQHKAFDPTFMSEPGTAFRGGSGAPGPLYWQNRADYNLAATLDTTQHQISGTSEIHYTNNSPDALHYLWLQVELNLFKKGSRGSYTGGVPTSAGGIDIQSVQVTQDGKTYAADHVITDTRMQVRLHQPVKPDGGKITVTLKYAFHIAKNQFRLAMMDSKNGAIYDVAQWYPRMCVYDDVRGWNTLPYQGAGEFYCEYGDFDYKVTVPADMIVAGAGVLQNPQEVLTKTEIKRLDKARQSDKTTFIIKPDEVGKPETRPVQKGMLTWHFKMENSRDVSWAASKAFIWDAAKANLPEGKTVLTMSVYPKESMGKNAWDRATEYLKHSIESFSADWYPYPYPTATNVGGPVGGMEYPGIIFCKWSINKARVMYFVTAHEIGHNWFPMLVGSDERRFGFMDEGLNTFIDIYAQDKFNHGEFGPKRDGEYDPEGKNPARDIVPFMTKDGTEAIMNFSDVLQWKNGHMVNYYKTSLGLVLLREYILGHDRFDYAFRTYIDRWAYKHPRPEDFFRTIDDAAGEDLGWFWNEWFYQTWTLDQAVTAVHYAQGKPEEGALITLKNNDQMVMPTTVKVVESNGKTSQVKLPVEIWQRGGTYLFKYASTSPIDSVIVDPDKQLPDVNPSNNVWTNDTKLSGK